ncbi:MAG: protein translocase subunit SecF [Spirochaetaceae bacterium]|jgi:preprotein translocase subunit SecF|nr:protein translocase subunit SecF [Spirochaetaceae bacterium]
MRRIIKFSRCFVFTSVLSLVLIAAGIAGYFVKGGFNVGIDFQAGLIQEVQLAPRAFSLSYEGLGNALLSLNGVSLSVAVSGVGIQGFTNQYLLADYGTIGAFAQALDQIEGVSVSTEVSGSTPFALLALDTQSTPALGSEPYWVHYLPLGAAPVPTEELSRALSGFGNPAVQALGDPGERRFMIRIQEDAISGDFQTTDIGRALDEYFGEGETVVVSSNYVGSRFSKTLADQAVWLLSATLLLILLYASIRFKPQYAVGAVLAIIHDGLIMVAFIAWSRMEFNTTTIAAILTILGYSINDTIVIFDRIRETRHNFPGDDFELILNRSITETLGRTFITTVTTMLAVLSLYIFTTGSMKDFALALLVGLISGVYSTIFIASGFVLFWDRHVPRGRAKKETEVISALET